MAPSFLLQEYLQGLIVTDLLELFNRLYFKKFLKTEKKIYAR